MRLFLVTKIVFECLKRYQLWETREYHYTQKIRMPPFLRKHASAPTSASVTKKKSTDVYYSVLQKRLTCFRGTSSETTSRSVEMKKFDLKPVKSLTRSVGQSLKQLEKQGFEPETPVLTNITTRNNMAIVKIPQMQKLMELASETDNNKLKFLRTESFPLVLPGSEKISVDVQIFLNGCQGYE